MNNQLDLLFNPKSVAVIGASRKKTKLGHQLLKNLQDAGFLGRTYPVNPKAQRIMGLRSYASILDIPASIDVVVLTVPSEIVSKVLEQCGEKGVKYAIIIPSGFAETGQAGLLQEKKIIEISKKYNIRVLGPNCLGLISPGTKLNLSFAKQQAKVGQLGLILQSGSMGSVILDWLSGAKIGISKFVSIGNKVDLDEIDLLKYLEKDISTKVIMLYLEHIKSGREFREEIARINRKKPVIILSGGITSEGAKAAKSHTGSLATGIAPIKAVCKQYGAILTSSIEEFFSTAAAFISEPPLNGRKIAVVTNAGGPATTIVDDIVNKNLMLAPLSLNTIKNLKNSLHQAANTQNPIDIVGDARASDYQMALNLILRDPNVDGVLVILTPQSMTEVKKTAQVILEEKSRRNKPVWTAFLGGKFVSVGVSFLKEQGLFCFNFPHQAIISISHIHNYYKTIKVKKIEKKISVPHENKEKVRKILNQDNKNSYKNTLEILKLYGIPLVPTIVTRKSNQLKKFVREHGFPVVLKTVEGEGIHKSVKGGVAQDLADEAKLESAFKFLSKKFGPKVACAKQISEGLEVLVGLKYDSSFGPIITFGLGGIFVETLKDLTYRIAPITYTDAYQMLQEISAHSAIFGNNTMPSLNYEAIIDIILRVSHLAIDFPEILELDLNPIKVNQKNAFVLDVRMISK